MPGKGFCAKNMAVIIAMSDVLQLQHGHRIRCYKFPKIKNSAKTGRKFTKCKCGAPSYPCGAPFEKRWSTAYIADSEDFGKKKYFY